MRLVDQRDWRFDPVWGDRADRNSAVLSLGWLVEVAACILEHFRPGLQVHHLEGRLDHRHIAAVVVVGHLGRLDRLDTALVPKEDPIEGNNVSECRIQMHEWPF